MAIDVATLVMDQLDPISSLDTTLAQAVNRAIEAQSALHEFTSAPDDQQKVLLSLYVLRNMIPRLALKFAMKIKDVESVKAKARYDRAVQYLDLLAKKIENEITDAEKEVTPETAEDDYPAWPGIGPVKWLGPDE
jgi:hypothetical protein